MKISKYKTLLNDDRQCFLVNENIREYETNETVLNNDESIVKMLCDVYKMDILSEEYVYLLCFNTKCKLLGVFEVTHGTVSTSLSGVREIFQKALLINAAMIIVAHNHPSGDPTPSKEDIAVYSTLKKAGELMQIPLMDNLVIGDGCHYSFEKEFVAKR